MTHITPAHAHMNIIQANNYSCSFFVVANLAKQLSNFKLKNIFYPWHLDNFRKWHIKAISPDVWRPEEQICRYSDIHSRKKNRKKTPSTTPFSITYEVAKCCCWISHFFEMPRPPLASSRHVAWPRIALTMLKKASNWRFPDTSREKWHLLRTSIWPEIWQDHWIMSSWQSQSTLLNNRTPPLFWTENTSTISGIFYDVYRFAISLSLENMWLTAGDPTRYSVPNRGNPQSDQTSKILNIDNEYHQTTGEIWTFQTN